MNILLYGISGAVVGRVADRYGFLVGDSLDAPHGGAGLLLAVPPLTTAGELLDFCHTMLAHEAGIDAAVVRSSAGCDVFGAVCYCSPPGKLFTLCGDADDGETEAELVRILDALLGLLCAHEGL